jgi:prepilin-type N-terminal cleavage/methylation domain-containing protein
MTISKNRGGFTLVELLVVIAIIGTLVGLLLPAVQSAREAARRSACTNNVKQLGLGLLNFESARKRLPMANSGQGTSSGAGTTGGYSWIVMILPFLEETNLYTQISSNSNRMNSGFTASINNTQAQTSLPQLVCPSFAGDKKSATAYGAGGSNVTSAAVTNYKANAASGWSAAGITYPDAARGGVLTGEKYGSESAAPYTGITLAQITDGTSKSFMIIESREASKAAWLSGGENWLTAANGAVNAATSGGNASLNGSTLAILDNTKTAGSWLGYWSGDTNVYGTSSNHQAGITLHGYADGHVGQVTPEIDTSLMLNLHTRGGSEPTGEQP